MRLSSPCRKGVLCSSALVEYGSTMLRSGIPLLRALYSRSSPWPIRKVSFQPHVPVLLTLAFPLSSKISMLISTVCQITNETKSCGLFADFRTPLPSSSLRDSTALQTCVQRIAATEPNVAIRYAYSYALYTSAIALGTELGMPRPVRLRGRGLDRAGRLGSRKKNLGPG